MRDEHHLEGMGIKVLADHSGKSKCPEVCCEGARYFVALTSLAGNAKHVSWREWDSRCLLSTQSEAKTADS